MLVIPSAVETITIAVKEKIEEREYVADVVKEALAERGTDAEFDKVEFNLDRASHFANDIEIPRSSNGENTDIDPSKDETKNENDTANSKLEVSESGVTDSGVVTNRIDKSYIDTNVECNPAFGAVAGCSIKYSDAAESYVDKNNVTHENTGKNIMYSVKGVEKGAPVVGRILVDMESGAKSIVAADRTVIATFGTDKPTYSVGDKISSSDVNLRLSQNKVEAYSEKEFGTRDSAEVLKSAIVENYSKAVDTYKDVATKEISCLESQKTEISENKAFLQEKVETLGAGDEEFRDKVEENISKCDSLLDKIDARIEKINEFIGKADDFKESYTDYKEGKSTLEDTFDKVVEAEDSAVSRSAKFTTNGTRDDWKNGDMVDGVSAFAQVDKDNFNETCDFVDSYDEIKADYDRIEKEETDVDSVEVNESDVSDIDKVEDESFENDNVEPDVDSDADVENNSDDAERDKKETTDIEDNNDSIEKEEKEADSVNEVNDKSNDDDTEINENDDIEEKMTDVTDDKSEEDDVEDSNVDSNSDTENDSKADSANKSDSRDENDNIDKDMSEQIDDAEDNGNDDVDNDITDDDNVDTDNENKDVPENQEVEKDDEKIDNDEEQHEIDKAEDNSLTSADDEGDSADNETNASEHKDEKESIENEEYESDSVENESVDRDDSDSDEIAEKQTESEKLEDDGEYESVTVERDNTDIEYTENDNEDDADFDNEVSSVIDEFNSDSAAYANDLLDDRKIESDTDDNTLNESRLEKGEFDSETDLKDGLFKMNDDPEHEYSFSDFVDNYKDVLASEDGDEKLLDSFADMVAEKGVDAITPDVTYSIAYYDEDGFCKGLDKIEEALTGKGISKEDIDSLIDNAVEAYCEDPIATFSTGFDSIEIEIPVTRDTHFDYGAGVDVENGDSIKFEIYPGFGSVFSNQFNEDGEPIVPVAGDKEGKEACKKHIDKNDYHYNKPHTYAMTAWRSPEVEKLFSILEDEKLWNKVLNILNEENKIQINENKHGSWVRPEHATPRGYKWKCSECGKEVNYVPGGSRKNKEEAKCGLPYCPYCKASMDGDENE